MIDKYYIDCTLKTLSTSQSNTGRVTKSYSDSTIKGYLGKVTSSTNNVVVTGGKPTFDELYNFYSSSFSFANGDLIVYESNTYEVARSPKNTANKDHHCKIFLKKVEGIT